MQKRNLLKKHRLRRQELRKQLHAQQLRRHQQWYLLRQPQLSLALLPPIWPVKEADSLDADPSV
jgi:DNA-binding transcriptional regulator PaaX